MEATKSDAALISLGKWIHGNGKDQNTESVNGKLYAQDIIRRSSHELAKTIPIIAMTANAFSENIQQSLSAGMNAHISKPVEMKMLEKTIRSIKFGGGGSTEVKVIEQ